MPIVDIDSKNKLGESRPSDIPRREFRNQRELGTSNLFSKDQKLDHIIQYIKGMKWTVDYFLQLRSLNDELTGLDIKLPANIQKYHRISKLIITMQSGIQQDNIENIEGEAIINAGFLPNKFDIIMATLTGGRQALFTVTEVDLRKYSLHDVYWVKFKLLTFVDTDHVELYNNLLYKTVKEYVYDKDHLLDYSAPVILHSDYNKKLSYKDRFKEVVEYYFDNFINEEKNVLAPPTKSSIYTDNMLTEFIFSIINQEDSDRIYRLKRLDITKSKTSKCSIWDAVLKRDISMLRRCDKNVGFKYNAYSTDVIKSRQNNYLGVSFIAAALNENEKGIDPDYKDISTYKDYFPDEPEQEIETVQPKTTPANPIKPNSRFDQVLPHGNVDDEMAKYVYTPVESKDDIQSYVAVKPSNLVIENNAPTLKLPVKKKKEGNEIDGKSINEIVATSEITIEVPHEDPKPTYDKDKFEKPIAHYDNTYVVSSYFYKQDLTMLGIVERALSEYMRGEIINENDMEKMLNQYHMWSTRDQFYLIPLLLVMIKDSIINTYKSL